MRRFLILIILLCVFSGHAYSGSVVNSVHNISYVKKTHWPGDADWNDYNQVCVYCHTPHSATVNVPLWNRQLGDPATFTPYTSANLAAPAPSQVSLLCLSCHDGMTALDAVANMGRGPVVFTNNHSKMDGSCMECHGTTDCVGSDCHRDFRGTIIGRTLADDHPVSIAYIPGFGLKMEPEEAGLKLFNGKVECASCHNVHNPDIWPFLRISNAGSNLCYACHDK